VAPNFTLDSVADSDYRGKCDVGGFLIFEWTLVNNLKNKVLSLVFFFGFWNGTIDIVCPFSINVLFCVHNKLITKPKRMLFSILKFLRCEIGNFELP
jgi:hypothetical protein